MKASSAVDPAVRIRRVSLPALAQPLLMAGPAILLVGALTWPLYLSHSSFAGSWLIHLWFMWKQSTTLRGGHLPSLFFNYAHGVFYPEYIFYGGTLYTLTGALSLLLGDSPVATYVLSYLLAFAASYGGWYWMARQAGLGRWQSHAPGLVFVTSSYYLTMIYADGDWAEFTAMSMIPLVIAAGISVLRARRLHAWPAAALAIGCVFFFGSHALTLVWGSTAMALFALLLLCIPQTRSAITRRGLVRVAGIMVPALLVCGWFLVPAAAYQSDAGIANQGAYAHQLQSSTGLVSMHHLFTLSRASAAPPESAFALSLPVLAMIWSLVALALALSAGLRRAPWTRALLVCAAFTALVVVAMTHVGLVLKLPRVYGQLQFSYRLEDYVLLGSSGAVLCALVLAGERLRGLRLWARWALPPVLVVAAIGAIEQTAAYPHGPNPEVAIEQWSQQPRAFESRTYEGSSAEASSSAGVLKDYVDVHVPVMKGTNVHPRLLEESSSHPPVLNGSFQSLPFLHFGTASPQGARISASTQQRSGALLDTNLFAWPALVHVSGARIVGINEGSGADILEVGRAPSSHLISVTPAASFPVALGRLLTLCGVIALALQFALLALRRLRRTA